MGLADGLPKAKPPKRKTKMRINHRELEEKIKARGE
jgi:hypothetical protein